MLPRGCRMCWLGRHVVIRAPWLRQDVDCTPDWSVTTALHCALLIGCTVGALLSGCAGKMLNGHEPKVVNGPEILNK